jgi:RHS repeat-associated protein
MELTASSGSVTDTRRYSAFGETTESTGTTSFPYQYFGQLGQFCDILTGDYIVRTRSYNPTTSRWLSADPLGFYAQQGNVYCYCVNSPLNASDPLGLFAFMPTEGPEDKPADCKCCCCVENLDVSKGSDIDRVPGIPGERWGKEFTVSIDTLWVEYTKDLDCKLEWWERMTHPLYPERGQDSNKWYDNFSPRSPTFEKWNARKKPCPNQRETVPVTDHPSVPLGGNLKPWTQFMWFVFKVSSASDCPCEIPFVVRYATLELKTRRGVGTDPRPFVVYDQRPDSFPDFPDNVPLSL